MEKTLYSLKIYRKNQDKIDYAKGMDTDDFSRLGLALTYWNYYILYIIIIILYI